METERLRSRAGGYALGVCGRIGNFHGRDDLQELFGTVNPDALEGEPRFNTCPTDKIPVVFLNREGERQAGRARWGLVPHWAEHPTRWRGATFNARSEDAHEKPAFRDAFRRGRILVPASGFYEWKRTDAGTVPHFVHYEDGRPLAFAGLMDVWRSADGRERLVSCTILTTTPNHLMAELHDRMPVLLAPEDFDRWLDRGVTRREGLEPLLRPAPAAGLRAVPVATVGEHPPLAVDGRTLLPAR